MKDIQFFLESTLDFTSSLIKYTVILENDGRPVLCNKLLEHGILINTYLYEAHIANHDSDVKFKLRMAIESIEEVLYWLLQCTKSNYFKEDPRLMRIGNRLIDDIKKLIE